MLAKYWKKIGMLILIIACVFNIMGKLVNKLSLNKEMLYSAEYIYNQEQKNETKADYNKEVEKEPKKDEQTKNDVIETNAEFNQENNTDLEEDNINNEENVISNEENNNVDIHNKDNKNIIAVVIIVALCVIILIIANIKRKRK